MPASGAPEESRARRCHRAAAPRPMPQRARKMRRSGEAAPSRTFVMRLCSSVCLCRLHFTTLRISVSPSIARRKGNQVPRPGFEPRPPRSKRGMISLSPSGREWTHRELNPNFQSAELASSLWTIGPIVNGPPEIRTPIAGLRRRSPPIGRAAHISSGMSVAGGRQSARLPGLSLPPTTDIPLSQVAEVGVEPTNLTRPSTWPLCRICVLGRQCRVQESHLGCRGYEPQLGTGPPGLCKRNSAARTGIAPAPVRLTTCRSPA